MSRRRISATRRIPSVLRRKIPPRDDDGGRMRCRPDRHEVACGVVFDVWRQHWSGDVRSHAAGQQRIAVRRRRRDSAAPQGAACAARVLDHQRLAEHLAIWSATMRATTSLGPPAGNGTITVMERDGKSWATARSKSHTTRPSCPRRMPRLASSMSCHLRSVVFEDLRDFNPAPLAGGQNACADHGK